MSARTRSVSAVIRLVIAPASTSDSHRRPEYAPGPPVTVHQPVGPGPLLLDPRVVREAASSSRGTPHSESLGFDSSSECARFAADLPRRAAQRVRIPGLACCVAGWSRPGGRARSESVLAQCSMLARPVSIELIDFDDSCLNPQDYLRRAPRPHLYKKNQN